MKDSVNPFTYSTDCPQSPLTPYEAFPYEARKGEKPNLEHVRLFGCLAYLKILQVHVKKLEDRSKDVVYLGKEPGTKASHLYDPFTGRLYVSRDVLYQEDEVWPWENKYKDDDEVRFPS